MVRKIVLFLACLAATAALAQDTSPRVTLHGFGEWAYVRTDGNEFLDGNEDGDYDTIGFGLNASTAIGERLTITGQLALRTREEDQAEAELDYAFAQWRFSDALQVRIGRSKHPFGLYTEVFDIGTLRPFFHLPLSIYGPSEIAAQSYNGIGLTGLRPTGGQTSLDYDLYAGEVTFDPSQRVDASEEGEQVRDVLGGRLRYHTAIDGLSFGVSAYTGVTEEEEEEGSEEGVETDSPRHVNLGVHAEYAMLPLTLRAEVGRHHETAEAKALAYYLEAAYRFGEHFELAGRLDRFDVTPEDEDDEGEDVDHRDIGIGVNYWFNPNFVLKASFHRVKGFAVASPADDDDLDDDETNAFVFGAQFSF